MFQINEQVQQGVSLTIPAPVGGWNARDPLDGMSELDAVSLVNFFPEQRRIELRKGYRSHSTGMGSVAVESLFEFNNQSGTRQLIACGNGNIYNATTSGAAATSLASGFSEDRWQAINFRARLVLVNGTDQPKQWDGASLTDATYTGIGTDNNLIDITHYRNRLYFVEKNTASVWYTSSPDVITGALTEFPLQSLLRHGGQIQAITGWSTAAGASINEYFVAVSTNGEVLVYSGPNPADASWTLVARAKFPPPVGRRCLLNYGKDCYIITTSGIISLGAALYGPQSAGDYETLTDKIQTAFNEAARDLSGNFGWQAINYPRGHYLLVNVPLVEGSQAEQYVMNTESGSWCKFKGMKAVCWCVFGDELYFGGPSGVVYKADTGKNDNGMKIAASIEHSFNYFGDRQQNKLFSLARPLIQATSTSFDVMIDVNTDFELRNITNTVSIDGDDGTPWGSPWGSPWSGSEKRLNNWYAVAGFGRCASLVLKGEYSGMDIALTATEINYVPAGIV